MYECFHMCINICIYIYTYIYTHIYIYIYIYIYFVKVSTSYAVELYELHLDLNFINFILHKIKLIKFNKLIFNIYILTRFIVLNICTIISKFIVP